MNLGKFELIKKNNKVIPISIKNLYNLEMRLKETYQHNIISEDHNKDFYDEISSLIPKTLTNFQIEKLFIFTNSIEANKSSKVKKIYEFLEYYLKSELGPFFYFTTYSVFNQIHPPKKSDDSLEVTNEHTLNSIQDSYISSHIIYWQLVTHIKNFIITAYKDDRYLIVENEIKHLANIVLDVFINLQLIGVKNIFYNGKSNDYYILNQKIETHTSFNFKAAMSRTPFNAGKYKDRVQIAANHEFRDSNWVIHYEQTITYNITHLRVFHYNNRHFTGIYPFLIKNDLITETYLKTKFYPDIEYIKHLKSGMLSNLNENEINRNLNNALEKIKECFDEKIWSEHTNLLINESQREYSFWLEEKKMYELLSNAWEDRPYYFTSFHEFRGRKLYPSPYSFTNLRLARTCFHYGVLEIKSSKYDWSEYSPIIHQIEKKYQIELTTNQIEIVNFWLISIGRHHRQMKKQTETHMYLMLEWGWQLFNEPNNILYEEIKENWKELSTKDRGDALLLEQSRYALNAFLLGDKTNRIISKDAVASGFLVTASIVKSDAIEKLKSVNISSSWVFVDTYLYIIDRFKKYKGENLNKIPTYLLGYLESRKIAKKFCMLISYSAGFQKAFQSIEPMIKREDINEANRLFGEFHTYIKERVWIDLGYSQSLWSFITSKENKYYAESETGKADFRYFHTISSTVDTRYKFFYTKKDVEDNLFSKDRKTRQFRTIVHKIDIKDTEKGLPPNTTHFSEGDPIRILHLPPYSFQFASIHDDYLLPASDCGAIVYAYANLFQMMLGIPFQLAPTILK